MGWGGMGWDGMGWDGMGWVRTEQDGSGGNLLLRLAAHLAPRREAEVFDGVAPLLGGEACLLHDVSGANARTDAREEAEELLHTQRSVWQRECECLVARESVQETPEPAMQPVSYLETLCPRCQRYKGHGTSDGGSSQCGHEEAGNSF